MPEKQELHPVLADVLKAEAAKVHADTARIVSEFQKRLGDGIFAEDLALEKSAPGKPLVLTVDWVN